MFDYQKNLRKEAMVKRLVISWIVIALVFFLLGAVIGLLLKGVL